MTVIFSDGQVGSTMETEGDFSAWTGQNLTEEQTLEVSITQKHHGVNSIKSITAGSGGQANIYKTISAASIVYLQFYVYVDSTSGTSYIIFGSLSGIYEMASIGITGATNTLYLRYRNGAGTSGDTSVTTLSTEVMHCIVLCFKQGNGDGEVHVFLDGLEVADLAQTELTNDNTISTVKVGQWANWRGATTSYADCVVVSDTYIGPEVASSGQQLFCLLNCMGY
jgi:hypothetical protein